MTSDEISDKIVQHVLCYPIYFGQFWLKLVISLITVSLLCLTHSLSLSLMQGDANRSYSDDDRSSCNFEDNDKQKDPLHLSGM